MQRRINDIKLIDGEIYRNIRGIGLRERKIFGQVIKMLDRNID